VKKSIRVLHGETGMNLYGGALQVLYLLQGLAHRNNIQNILVCPEGSALADAARGYVKTLHTVPMKGDLDLLFIPRLLRIIDRENPDIIHLHSRRGADIMGGIAAKVKGTPSILTRRVDNPEPRLWVALKYRLYARIITISEGISRVLAVEGVDTGKITCIPSAVDVDRYSTPCDREWFRNEFALEENSQACGVIAQFIERKGHRFLLAAIPEILLKLPRLRFILFGKGPLEKNLRTMCRDLGVGDKVIFAGFRDDLDRIMGCLDLLIHPALMEGLGVSLLQAAAAGVPIVGTRVGGIPEIVRDGVNGYLVSPADPHSITEASVRILSDFELARQMGINGNKLVEEHFSIDSMVRGNLEVYREMMREGP
jgi:glycosyltransferase involved in cell wall biosynthesis